MQPSPVLDRGLGPVLTVPNALSGLRLLGVPLFLWLVLGPHADAAALGVLMFSGASDFFDGVLARALNQTSRLGAILDPLADRLYIAATLVAFTIRHVSPLWLLLALVARDLALTALLPGLRRMGYGPLPVHYLGKSATLCLLYAFPLLLWGAHHGTATSVARALGWAFTLWGAALYWWAGVLYVVQFLGLRRIERAAVAAGTHAPAVRGYEGSGSEPPAEQAVRRR